MLQLVTPDSELSVEVVVADVFADSFPYGLVSLTSLARAAGVLDDPDA